jgi:putative protein-disulfide isomerase
MLKKYLLIILFGMITTSKSMAQQDTLIYIGDPLCSWCYGIAPDIAKVKAAFPNVPFEMVMGGLRPGGRESLMDLKKFLHHHWLEVAQTTGQKFNFGILEKGDVIYDTEYACRAVIVADQVMPGIKYDYFNAVQTAFYQDNIKPNDVDAYVQLAIKLGLDGQAFHKKFQHRQSRGDAYSEFDLAGAMGVKSFPTVIAKMNNKLYLVTSGYANADKMIAILKGRGFGEADKD